MTQDGLRRFSHRTCVGGPAHPRVGPAPAELRGGGDVRAPVFSVQARLLSFWAEDGFTSVSATSLEKTLADAAFSLTRRSL